MTVPALLAARITQRCDRCHGPHGRPSLDGRPEVGLSWSHTRAVVAAAVGDGRVGVAVEQVDASSAPPRRQGR